MSSEIDFVVPWLDSSDPAWQEEFQEYSLKEKGHKEAARFRNMDIFQYWFRAVEAYAPWVRKVFLITNGTFPKWINREHPKLVLVNHSDYIPAEYLPTFNANTIELHIHRIEGLSEKFVYFNDDFFLNAPVTPEYYFKDGLPCDTNKETCLNVPIYDSEDKFGIYMMMLADIGIINGHFNRWDVVKQSPRRWLGPHLRIRGLAMSAMLSCQRRFVGFSFLHSEQAFLKSVLEEVWQQEPEFLNESCSRFRADVQANQYVFRYWQFASNRFYPSRRSRGFVGLRENMLGEVERLLHQSSVSSLCLNDSPVCPDAEYEVINKRLQELFKIKFPQKSSFEI